MNLKAQREAALKAARDVAERVKAEGRGFTDEEKSEVESFMSKADELTAQIKAADEAEALMSRIGDLGGAAEVKSDDEEPAAKSIGEHFAKSVGSKALVRLKQGNYSVAAPEFKAATDAQATPSVFVSPLLTDVDRTIVRGYRRPVVSDLLGTGTLSGTAVTYFVEGAFEGGFTTVAEKGQKPQLHVADPTAVTDSVKKIAAWWDTSDEMIEDLPFWVSEINNRALYELALVEEDQLLNGSGSGSNVLGMLQRSGVQSEGVAHSGDSAADALFRAMTKVQTATGLTADALIINPVDYQDLRLNKDGNGQYFGGGYFQGQYGNGGVPMQPPIWGLNTVVSAAVAQGTAVVGALKQATTVYRKGGIRVESTNSDSGKFTTNIVTTRIEERIALAVRIPSAIVQVTLTPAASSAD